MDAQRLLTASLRAAPWGATVAQIMAAALAAVEPGAAVARYLRRADEQLFVGERSYDLASYERIYLIAAGKAAAPMAHAAAALLGERLTAGVEVAKRAEGSASQPAHVGKLMSFHAGHPIPDEAGVAAGRAIASLLGEAGARDLVLVLLSGGGSALLTLPAASLTLDDLRALTRALLGCGATINEINCLRKHLDLVKGGGLARMAASATLATLILSDVVGSPLDVIASGPTVPDPTTFADALAVLDRYALRAQVPAAIVAQLEAGVRGELPDTPKVGDALFARVQNLLVGSNQQAAAGALEAARSAGFNTCLLTTYLQGEARAVGGVLAAVAREIAASDNPLPRPACIVVGGETTVTLRGDGRGGRNQELALAAVADLAGLREVALITLATDGGDGPTDAAGAVVTGETSARAAALGYDPAAHLARNDAYPFFAALGDLLLPGPTATNVNDLAFIFAL